MTRTAMAAIAAGVLLAFPPAASASTIVPKKSIAGVELHSTRDDVRATLGEPTSRFRRHWGVSDEKFPAWRYRAKRLVVVFVGGEALFIQTRSRGERTSRGIGPGSSREALLQSHPSVNCVSARFCELGSATGVQPKPYTGFWLRHGRVRSVEVSVATP